MGTEGKEPIIEKHPVRISSSSGISSEVPVRVSVPSHISGEVAVEEKPAQVLKRSDLLKRMAEKGIQANPDSTESRPRE